MNAKKNLKQKIRTTTEAKRALRANIRELKKAGPTTGEKRHQLKQNYDDVERPVARATHLAYGILRGRKYAQIEQKCEGAPNPNLILEVLQEAGEDGWNLTGVLDWLQPLHNFVETWKLWDMARRAQREAHLKEHCDRIWDMMTPEQRTKAKERTSEIGKARDEVA